MGRICPSCSSKLAINLALVVWIFCHKCKGGIHPLYSDPLARLLHGCTFPWSHQNVGHPPKGSALLLADIHTYAGMPDNVCQGGSCHLVQSCCNKITGLIGASGLNYVILNYNDCPLRLM